MAKVSAVLLRPLDGQVIGDRAEFDKADFDRLEKLGAVKAAPAPKNKAAPEASNKAAPEPAGKRKGDTK